MEREKKREKERRDREKKREERKKKERKKGKRERYGRLWPLLSSLSLSELPGGA